MIDRSAKRVELEGERLFRGALALNFNTKGIIEEFSL